MNSVKRKTQNVDSGQDHPVCFGSEKKCAVGIQIKAHQDQQKRDGLFVQKRNDDHPGQGQIIISLMHARKEQHEAIDHQKGDIDQFPVCQLLFPSEKEQHMNAQDDHSGTDRQEFQMGKIPIAEVLHHETPDGGIVNRHYPEGVRLIPIDFIQIHQGPPLKESAQADHNHRQRNEQEAENGILFSIDILKQQERQEKRRLQLEGTGQAISNKGRNRFLLQKEQKRQQAESAENGIALSPHGRIQQHDWEVQGHGIGDR